MKDILIIGFDDSNFCSYVILILISVKKDLLIMSEYGGISLINLIKNKEVDKEKVYIELRFIVREFVVYLKE